MKKLLLVVLSFLLLVFSITQPVYATVTASGTANQIFEANCAGCHINGSNIVRRNKNLFKKALKRNSMDSIEAISDIVTNGKNNMPAYKDRLAPQQIHDVAAYVLQQAENNWRR
ncbi:MAG: c-type cytochrome [Calothrix sp. C42_A2020_038]|nr:c-type cytochrome [Calothrix sp. C42_A2020_038]